MQPLRKSFPDNGDSAGFHVVQTNKTLAHLFELARVRPVRFVNYDSLTIDQIDHIRKQAIGFVRCSVKIVDKDREPDLLQLSQLSGVRRLLLQRQVMRKFLSGVRFTHVDNKNRKTLVLILFVKFGE